MLRLPDRCPVVEKIFKEKMHKLFTIQPLAAHLYTTTPKPGTISFTILVDSSLLIINHGLSLSNEYLEVEKMEKNHGPVGMEVNGFRNLCSPFPIYDTH